MKAQYRSKEDSDLARAWMEKHEQADELVFDTECNLVVKAVYYEPVYAYYKEAAEEFGEFLRTWANRHL